MAYTTTETQDMYNGKHYIKIRITTSNKIMQYESVLKKKSHQEDDRPTVATKENRVVSRIDPLIPLNREIIRISAPLKDLNEFLTSKSSVKDVEFNSPMSINVQTKYQPQVEVRCHESGEDRANIFVVAFPFNGMIKPIPENPQYRIYKGLIATSAKSFFYNGRKYRKVLYLIIEVNKNLFNESHKYHTDKIDISLESYALFNDRETGEQKTNIEKYTLTVLSPMGDYESSWEYDTVNEAIMMNVEPGQQLWTTYSFNKNNDKRSNNQNQNDYRRKGGKKNLRQKPSYVEGNMIVTTNKNGIRKEIPMKQNYRGNRNYHNNSRNGGSNYNDLDYMMQKSGMYDHSEDNRGKRNGGKKGNKRNNRNY